MYTINNIGNINYEFAQKYGFVKNDARVQKLAKEKNGVVVERQGFYFVKTSQRTSNTCSLFFGKGGAQFGAA